MPEPSLNRPLDAKRQAEALPGTPPIPAADASPSETVLPADLAAAFQSAPDSERKLAALRQHFELKAINDAADLQPGVLCALRKDAELYLVEIGPLNVDQRTVDLRLRVSARHAKPAPLAALVELGRKGSLHRLEAKAPDEAKAPAKLSQDPLPGPSESESATDVQSTSDAESETINWAAETIDLTAFTRLISLAQSCGMVSNVDNIATVRDAEFRAGHYLTAFYNIERMHTELNAAAQQRQQQLRREQTAYRSGKLRMSPKEWNQKVARETAKTQSIDRALSQFRKVMAGLRSRALVAQQTGDHGD